MNRDDDTAADTRHLQHVLLVTAVILLPGLLGTIFGWVHGLLPLLVFSYLRLYGKNRGKKYLLYGGLLACAAGLIFHIVEELFFSLTLVPVGFILAESVDNGDAIHLAGIKGSVTLAASWLLVTIILTFGMEQHPYSLLLESLSQGMDEAIGYYKTSSSVPAETIYLLEQTFAQIKVLIPKVMPGILTCLTLLVTWFTMVAGNRLLYKKTGSGPWPEYRFWKLPERLIWAPIVSGVLVLLPMEPGRTIGMNILMVSGLLYCFQGLAIMGFYFYKWSVPVFVRALIYAILFFQSFGAVFLAVLGVIDVWADLRRLNKVARETEN